MSIISIRGIHFAKVESFSGVIAEWHHLNMKDTKYKTLVQRAFRADRPEMKFPQFLFIMKIL